MMRLRKRLAGSVIPREIQFLMIPQLNRSPSGDSYRVSSSNPDKVPGSFGSIWCMLPDDALGRLRLVLQTQTAKS